MELVKIDPKDYGLEETKGLEIEQSFNPATSEFIGLSKIYDEIINSELTTELSVRAANLITILSHCNGAIDRIHKSQKAYYLAGGNFVDAIKNKNKDVIKEMQDMLKPIRDYKEIIESERLEKLQLTRAAELEKYGVEIIPDNLGTFNDDIWNNYLTGVKANYEAQKEAERKAEEERIKKEEEINLHISRKNSVINLWQFMPEENKETNFGLWSNDMWLELVNYLKLTKKEYDKEQEQIRLENEKLKKQAEEKAKNDEVERKKRDAEQEKMRKEKARIEAELQAKKDAELKAKKEAEKKAEAELKKGDTDKITDLKKDLELLKTKYTFKSASYKKKYEGVGQLIDKVIIYIN